MDRMEPVLTQQELHNKLLSIGWTPKSIKMRKGLYAAVIESSTGEKLEIESHSPAMALAQLYLQAQRRNGTKPRVASGEHVNHWQELADEYDKLPIFDQKAVSAWKALASECKIIAKQIGRQVDVQVVRDPSPYATVDELHSDVQHNRRAKISGVNTNHPVWDAAEAVAFRTVFEILGRAGTNSKYTWIGLNRSFQAVKPLVSDLAKQALFVETIAQGASMRKNGRVEPKVSFMDEALGHRVASGEPICAFAGCGKPADIILRYSDSETLTCLRHERQNSRVLPGALLERIPVREAYPKVAALWDTPQKSALGRLKRYFKDVKFKSSDAAERFGFRAGAFAQATPETLIDFLDSKDKEMRKKLGENDWHEFRQETLKAHKDWYRHQPLLWMLHG